MSKFVRVRGTITLHYFFNEEVEVPDDFDFARAYSNWSLLQSQVDEIACECPRRYPDATKTDWEVIEEKD